MANDLNIDNATIQNIACVNAHTQSIQANNGNFDQLYVDGSTYSNGSYLTGSNNVIQIGAEDTKNSVKISPPEGGIFVSDGNEWHVITDIDKSKKYDAALKVLAEDYPEVLADLVLRGIVL